MAKCIWTAGPSRSRRWRSSSSRAGWRCGENGSGKSTIVEARAWSGERLQERSHGESFLAVLRNRFDQIGVYFLDEPEAALSFRSCLGLVALLDVLRGARSG